MKTIAIAIDGHSSCGKSTLAQDLASKLNFTYIDSGAMYRAVTYFFLKNKIDYSKTEKIEALLEDLNLSFEKKMGGQQDILLNGENISREIRSREVNEHVSPVATISEVRRFLVEKQRGFRTEHGIVMDGRDIGTVVFPNAELKLFLTANIDVRAQRRFLELQQNNRPLDLQIVKQNLKERDRIDSTRQDSPLTIAQDAVVLDTSHLDKKEQFLMIYVLALCRMDALNQLNL